MRIAFWQRLYAAALAAIGIETIACARTATFVLGPHATAIPVIPWLPAVPSLGYAFGAAWIVLAAGIFSHEWRPPAALIAGSLLFACALVLDVPRYAPHPASVPLRTLAFEPLAIAAVAWLLPGRRAILPALAAASRWLLGLCLVVFGADHFLALAPIAALVPRWIPWHAFWTAFFGAGFMAAGLCIALGVLRRWAAGGIGLMFALWVVTLHLPRVAGLYGIPGAPHDPDEYSSLFIALAICAGSFALASDGSTSS